MAGRKSTFHGKAGELTIEELNRVNCIYQTGGDNSNKRCLSTTGS